MKRNSVKIGISLGDPAGIGPEVVLGALGDISKSGLIPIVCGRREIIERYYPALTRDCIIINSRDDAAGVSPGKKYFFDIPADLPVPAPGSGSPGTGLESRMYIDACLDLWKAGLIDAFVTGPVSKAYVERPDLHFTGHTEYIADYLGEKNPFMMMYSRYYRVILVTTHIPVADIPESIDAEKIYRTILAGHDSIGALDNGELRLAIAGLDPHCGDSGAIGTFDSNVTAEAVRTARSGGIDIEGPLSADTLFMPRKWRSYNLVVAHYHDQGLIPFKMLAFDKGVNVTLGLSIIRTSPDHGTAYDIAGKGKAGHDSMLEAIKLAYRLALSRKGRK